MTERQRRKLILENIKLKEVIEEMETRYEYQDKLDELWDNENGLGAVSNSLEYPNYRMRISSFLDLVPKIDTSDLEFYKKHIRDGGKYGMSLLLIDEVDGQWEVYDHEGRHRLEAIAETLGDGLYVPVTIIMRGMKGDVTEIVDTLRPQYGSKSTTPRNIKNIIK